jgi:glycine hydroxymethyltransferase
MPKIADLIDRVITNIDNEKVIAEVRSEVNNMMNGLPLFSA